MAQEKGYTITIDQLGTPAIEAQGFAGKGCLDATAAVEAALNGGKVARTNKAEMNKAEVKNTIKQHG